MQQALCFTFCRHAAATVLLAFGLKDSRRNVVRASGDRCRPQEMWTGAPLKHVFTGKEKLSLNIHLPLRVAAELS